MASVWYATREDVKGALDSQETARNNAQVDRAIEAASRSIEALTHRRFYPFTGTRFFDWPSDLYGPSTYRLRLGRDELISVSTLTSDGTVIASTDYFLEPANSGPPFTRLDLDLSTLTTFVHGDTPQRSIEITGVFGYRADEEPVGTLSANLDASETATASINWSTSRFGVGDVLRIDSERMIITERTMVDSTQNLGVSLTASNADVTVAVTTGSAFAADQIILIGSERMLVVDVAGNNLTVRRAWDGSVLAAHTAGVDIFTLTGVEVDRAELGTTLAAHLSGAAIYRHVVPSLIRQLCIAEALVALQHEGAAYARRIGSGDNERPASGAALPDLRTQVLKAHRRVLVR